MKIDGPKRTGKTGKSKKSGQVSDTEAAFESYMAKGATKASGAAPTQSIAQVDALLALQGTESATERKARARMQLRANHLLDSLDDIRGGLLTGTLTLGHCVDVADVVASHREKITDPALSALLDEIDLRAQVEIAKMRKAMPSA